MLTDSIKELKIISHYVTWGELFAAYICMTGILIAIAFGIYDRWFNRK